MKVTISPLQFTVISRISRMLVTYDTLLAAFVLRPRALRSRRGPQTPGSTGPSATISCIVCPVPLVGDTGLRLRRVTTPHYITHTPSKYPYPGPCRDSKQYNTLGNLTILCLTS